mgnify:FL=1
MINTWDFQLGLMVQQKERTGEVLQDDGTYGSSEMISYYKLS